MENWSIEPLDLSRYISALDAVTASLWDVNKGLNMLGTPIDKSEVEEVENLAKRRDVYAKDAAWLSAMVVEIIRRGAEGAEVGNA
jgi:hypothetical protein